MAGLIKVEKLDRASNGRIVATLDVRTSMGQMMYPMQFDDQGSMSANERQAFLELKQHLEEALALVQHQLG